MFINHSKLSKSDKARHARVLIEGFEHLTYGTIQGIDGLSGWLTFRLSDQTTLLSKGMDFVKPVFSDFSSLDDWAKTNGFRCIGINLDKEKNITNVPSDEIKCIEYMGTGYYASISIFYCLKSSAMYSDLLKNFVIKFINEFYNNQDSIVGVYKSLLDSLLKIKSLLINKVIRVGLSEQIRKEQVGVLEEYISYFHLEISKYDKNEKIDKSGLEILYIIINADHVRFKSSMKNTDFLWIIPIYAWVNQSVGAVIEKKAKSGKIKTNDQNINMIELFKMYATFYPKNSTDLIKIANYIEKASAVKTKFSVSEEIIKLLMDNDPKILRV